MVNIRPRATFVALGTWMLADYDHIYCPAPWPSAKTCIDLHIAEEKWHALRNLLETLYSPLTPRIEVKNHRLILSDAGCSGRNQP